MNAAESSGNGERYWAGVVGKNARTERRALGWSQELLSTKLREAGWATSQGMISAMERNSTYNGQIRSRVVLTIDRVGLLADILGVTISILLDEGTTEN